MKLRLPLNRSIGPGLVALVAALVRDAAEQLAEVTVAPDDSVHRARVALKRARSTLRLLEKSGAAWAIMPRYRLAELGVRMSAARENAVAAALARKLSRRLRGREREVAALLATRPGPLGPSDAGQIRQALLVEVRDLVIAPAPPITPGQLRGLLRQSHARTDRRYLAAVQKPTLESVHEWRKAVIILRDQTTLAAGRWPQGAGVAQPLLVRLSRQIGRRGDMALLLRRLQRRRMAPPLQAARRKLIARLAEQCQLATLSVLVGWLQVDARLTRLLAEKETPRRAAGPVGRALRPTGKLVSGVKPDLQFMPSPAL